MLGQRNGRVCVDAHVSCLHDTLCSSVAHRAIRPQVASGRFGVTPQFLVNADQLEIKIAQGAKPGAAPLLMGAGRRAAPLSCAAAVEAAARSASTCIA